MADDDSNTGVADDEDIKVTIPDETKQKYPDLVKMIMASKSMNNQERNYWLQVLPVMTEEQVQELRNILETEIKKLADIEKKYGKKPEKIELSKEDIKKMDEEKKKKRLERMAAEKKAAEKENPDDLLAELGL